MVRVSQVEIVVIMAVNLSEDRIWAIAEKMQGEIAKEIRVMLGEEAYNPRIFTEEERVRRITAMRDCAANSTSDAERHESWCKMHVDAGWVYGESFDPVAKTHPNLMPWDQLPSSTRSKARIFDIVARAAREICEGQ